MNTTMSSFLRWILWLWICLVILGALLWAPLAAGFSGVEGESPQTSRIVFFHVPLSISSFIGFLAAGWWSVLYLWKRRESDDHAACAAVEVSLVFCALATLTGAMWSRVQWGAYWNWDPRQTSIALALVFYGAYMSLRGAIDDPEARARIAGAYAALGLAIAPFLFFIMPRMASFSLHPKPGGAEMDSRIGTIVVGGIIGFTALFFWMQNLRGRTLALEAGRDDQDFEEGRDDG